MRTGAVEQPSNVHGAGRVAAQQSMRPEQPEVAGSRNRLGRRLRDLVLFLGCSACIESIEQPVELVLGKAEQIESNALFLEPLELGGQQCIVPAGVEGNPVVGQAKSPRLRVGQVA